MLFTLILGALCTYRFTYTHVDYNFHYFPLKVLISLHALQQFPNKQDIANTEKFL